MTTQTKAITAQVLLVNLLFWAIYPTVLASQELAKRNKCMVCHAINEKLVGPALKDVANQNVGRINPNIYLAKKIQEGSVGAWGQIPMPSNQSLSNADALLLANWILSIKN